MNRLAILKTETTGDFSSSVHLDSKVQKCETHGEFESKKYFHVWTRCPECVRIEKEAEASKRLEDERIEKIAKWTRTLNDACIPIRHQEKTFDKFIAETDAQAEAMLVSFEFADKFSENKGRSLVFCGKPGTGKTHLAASIAMYLLKEGRTVLFLTVMKAIRSIKETWSKNSNETEADVIKKFTYPDLLILDEVGVQFGSDAEKLLLFDILNERYENKKPTIIISNLTVKEIADYLGERIIDRLKEDGGRSVVFNWESNRGKNA